MSGGRWGYQQLELTEQAEVWSTLMQAVAQTEHIVDWWASHDSSAERAGQRLLDLWRDTFDEAFRYHQD